MIDTTTAPLGALLLRVSLGTMFIAHSVYLKLVVFTLPGTAQFFQSLGLPGWAAYATFALERKLPYKRLLIVTGVLISLVLVVLVVAIVVPLQRLRREA